MKQLKILFQVTKRTSSLERYFKEIDKVQLISAEEEVALTKRIKQGDQIAVEKLTKANLRFVVSVAKQYDRGIHGMSLGDLISEGNIGLIKAAGKFDETRGFKFISYAVWWIRQSIIASISENSRIVRQPMNRVNDYNQMVRSLAELEQKYEREPTNEELAEALHVKVDKVVQIKRVGSKPSSLDAPLISEEAVNLLDVLVNPEANNPESDTLLHSLKTDINNALRILNTRESAIMVLFYGLNGENSLSLNDIAVRLEISNERVRQIKECALRKLQSNMTGSNRLKAYLG